MVKSSCLYKNAIEKLSSDLKLNKGDQYTQDWEYEVSEMNKINEFIEYYKNTELNSIEKRILINIILESYNDYVGERGEDSYYSEILNQILKKDFILYKDIIQYWSCEGEELIDAFYLTPLMRKIIDIKDKKEFLGSGEK